MKYRSLGKTGIEVSEIGFGTWGLGGTSYGPTDDTISLNAIAKAIERGVNFFDTADIYGNGHSEKLLGEAISGVRDQVVISSKGGYCDEHNKIGGQRLSSNHLRQALENSLRRLKCDYVDIYHLHSPDIEGIELTPILETLEEFKSDQLIHEYAISVRSPDCGLIAIERYGFSIIQVNFNLLDQRAIDNGLFELAASREVGIIVRTPLTFGFLTGVQDPEERFSKLDHRSRWPVRQRRRWVDGAGMFDFISGDRSKAQRGLRFCLDFEAVSTVIPGMLCEDHVNENVEVSDSSPFSMEEHKKIRDTYKRSTFADLETLDRSN